MITTTYSKFAGLEINLPTADAPAPQEQPNEINVMVTAAGDVTVNKAAVVGREVAAISAALLQAAQQAGLNHVSFAIQQPQH